MAQTFLSVVKKFLTKTFPINTKFVLRTTIEFSKNLFSRYKTFREKFEEDHIGKIINIKRRFRKFKIQLKAKSKKNEKIKKLRNLEFKRLLIKFSIKLKSGINSSILIKERFNSGLNLIRIKSFYTNRVLPILRSLTKVVNNNYYLSLEYLKRGYKLLDKTIHSSNFNKFLILVFFIFGAFIVEDQLDRIKITQKVPGDEKAVNINATSNTHLVFEYDYELTTKTKILKYIIHPALASDENQPQLVLTDHDGKKHNPEFVVDREGEESFSVRIAQNKIPPGAYEALLEVYKDGVYYQQEKDFTYGVLSVNTNKATFTSGEEITLNMGALKNDGHTICDADLELKITSPSGKESNPDVEQSGFCERDNVTNVPDYLASHKAEEVGRHKMTLVNKDNGYQIEDYYEVQTEVPYSIERKGPSRIYPFVAYPMEITVTANQDFTGKIIEKVPKGFLIKGLETSEEEEWQTIIWDVDLKNGEKATYSYFFDAPDISPFLYLTGPLTIGDYQEVRMWQIASDADGSGTNVVVPTGVLVSSTDETFTFTYDPSELFDSGELAIKVPTSRGWSTPQGSAGTAGYTTVSGSGNTTIGEVLVSGDSTSEGVWTLTEDDSDMCNTTASPFVDTTTKKEGAGAIQCNNSGSAAPDDTDTFSFDATAQDWSSYTQISFWLRSTKALTSAAGIDFGYDNNAAFGSPTAIFDTGTVSANTWTYFVFDMTGTRTAITAFGLICDTTGCDTNTFWLDEVMVGPSSPTFVANGPDVDIRARFIDLASTDTVTVTYGAGGGTSGADVPITAGLDEFTTRTRFDAGGTLTNISSHPVINVQAAAIDISGTCKQSDQSTDCTDTGTVRVAVNGTLQAQTQPTVSGSWTISGVSPPILGDVITVFIDGAGEADEAVAVTTYDGSGNIAGIELIAERLSLGNSDTRLLSNDDLSQYDNSVSADEDIFFDVDGSNNLTMNETGKTLTELYINSTMTLNLSGNITVNDLEVNGTLVANSYTINVTGDGTPFVITGTFNEFTSNFIYSSTSNVTVTAETYYNLFLQPSGAGSPTYQISGIGGSIYTRNLTFGDGTNPVIVTQLTWGLFIGGNWTLNSNSTWNKSFVSVTLNGTTSPVSLTDNNSTKQDLGKVTIDGPKTVNLASSITVETMDITSGDTLNLGDSGYVFKITGSNTSLSLGGTLNVGTNSTVEYTGTTNVLVRAYSYSNLVVNQSGTNFTTDGNVTVAGVLTIENGTFSPGLSTITLSGSSTPLVINGVVDEGTSTFNYTGTSATNITITDYYNLYISYTTVCSTVTFTVPAGTLNVANNLYVGYSTACSPTRTFDVNTNDPAINVEGEFVNNNTGIYLASSNQASPLSVVGNFTNNGIFTHNNGKVILNGEVDTTQTFLGNITLHTLEITTGDRIVTFGVYSTKTIVANGSLTLTGTDCSNMMRIRSSSAGAQSTLDVDVSATASVSHVDLQDINLTTKSISAGNSINSGNNSANWTISPNGCIGTSTNQDTTGSSFQRKVIYDDQNSRYWSFNHDGDEIEVKYSSDEGSTWTNPATTGSGRLPYDTNDFSVWWRSIGAVEYIVVAVADGGNIKLRQGILSGTDVTWDTDVSLAMDETGTYSRPYVSFDSANHIWVGATYLDSSNYVYKTVVSAEAGSTDPSTWTWTTTPYQLSNAQTSSNVYGTLTALSSEDMYATFVVDTDLLGCRWDDSDNNWEDSTGASCTSLIGGSEETYFDSLQDGMVGYWKMDEASWNGTTGEVIDSTISNYDGTAQGGATTAGAGFNRSGSFAGDNDYINAGDVTELNNASEFSISQWVYITDVTADDRIFHKAIDGSNDISIAPYEVTTQRIYFEIGNGSNSYGYWDSTGVISNNNWYHITAVFDGSGSTNADKAKLYINGMERAMTYTGTIPTTTANLSTYDVKLGTGDAGEYFTGKLDDVRVYGRAITSEEVWKLYEYVPDSVNIDDASDFQIMTGASRTVVRTTSGTLYSFITHLTNCEMWKSTNGINWVLANATSISCTPSMTALAIDSSDNIHVAYLNSQSIRYRKFITSTDAWDVSGELTIRNAIDSVKEVSISADSNDKPHAAFITNETLDSLDNEVGYSNAISGTWKSRVVVEASTNYQLDFVDITIDEDNVPLLSYVHSTDGDLSTAGGNQNDATSFSVYDVDVSVNTTADESGASIGVDKITGKTWVAYVDSTGAISMAMRADGNESSSWSSNWSTITSKTDVGYEPSIAFANMGEVYVFYENDQGDIAYDIYDPVATSWVGEIVLHEGTFRDVKAKWSFESNNFGVNRIDYLYSDSTDLYYNSLYLRRTPNNIDDASDFGDLPLYGGQIVRTSNGILYGVLNDGGLLEVWKFVNGSQWTQMDSANSPTTATGAPLAVAINSSDSLEIIFTSSTGLVAQYTSFSTSTDTFSGSITSNLITYTTSLHSIDIVIDFNDRIHFIASGADGSGTVFNYVKYRTGLSGGWSGIVNVVSSTGGQDVILTASLTMSDEDLPEVVYWYGPLNYSTFSYARGNSNLATSFSSYNIDSSGSISDNSLKGADIAVDALTGNTWIAYTDSSNLISLAYQTDGSVVTAGWTIITSKTDVGYKPTIEIRDSKIYVFYENDQDNIAYDVYDSTWSGEKVIEEHGLLEDVKAKWSYAYNYDKTGVAANQLNTYYFDGSDLPATDIDNVWTNETNMDDGDAATYGFTSTGGTKTSNEVQIAGTNAPASGGTINRVMVRVSNGTSWGASQTVTAPTGGWTWQEVQNLEMVAFYYTTAFSVAVQVFQDGDVDLVNSLAFATVFNVSGAYRLSKVEIIVESTNSTYADEIDYLYSDGTDVFYNRVLLEGSVPGVTDSIATGLSTGLNKNISTVGQTISTIDYVHLAYVNSSGNIYYDRYDGDWDFTNTSLDANTDNTYLGLSKDTATSDVYLGYIGSSSDDIFTKKATYSAGPSWSWGTSTTLVTDTTEIFTNYSANNTGNGKVGAIYSIGDLSPYNIGWETVLSGSTNNAPTVSNVVVNGASNISLTAGSTHNVSWTATITDLDGNAEIAGVTGKLYRSGVAGAESCTANNNNCYADAVCDLTGCAGNTCTATCTSAMYFHADATDANSTMPSEYWRGWMEATDSHSDTGSEFSATNAPDVESLAALDIISTIEYGLILAGDSSAEKTTLVTNEGNIILDLELSGDNMCTDYPTCAGSTIPVGQQEYSMSTFTYGTGTDLTSTAFRIQFDLGKPTTSPSTQTKNLYWRLGLTGGQDLGVYSGSNVVLSKNDNVP